MAAAGKVGAFMLVLLSCGACATCPDGQVPMPDGSCLPASFLPPGVLPKPGPPQEPLKPDAKPDANASRAPAFSEIAVATSCKSQKWIGEKDTPPDHCFQVILQRDDCSHEYFTHATDRDGNCGCIADKLMDCSMTSNQQAQKNVHLFKITGAEPSSSFPTLPPGWEKPPAGFPGGDAAPPGFPGAPAPVCCCRPKASWVPPLKVFRRIGCGPGSSMFTSGGKDYCCFNLMPFMGTQTQCPPTEEWVRGDGCASGSLSEFV